MALTDKALQEIISGERNVLVVINKDLYFKFDRMNIELDITNQQCIITFYYQDEAVSIQRVPGYHFGPKDKDDINIRGIFGVSKIDVWR